MSNVPAPRGQQAIAKPAATLETWLESDGFRAMVAKALPRHLTPDRFLRVALTAVLRTPKLSQCTQESVTQCLLQCSQFGLEPDGRRAHLIPFDDKRNNRTICTLILDYKGLVELAMRSGLVSHLHADVVRDGDLFSYSLGEIREHVPWFLRRDADKPSEAGPDIAVYAFARMKDGASAVAVMSIDEVYAIRDGSQGYKAWKAGYVKSSTWDPDNWVAEQEMKKKTALRRLTKMLPLSPEFRDAVEADDALETAVAVEGVATTVSAPIFRQATVTAPAPVALQPELTPAVEVNPAPVQTPPPAPVAQSEPAQANQDEIKHLWDSVLKVTNFDGFRDWALANRYAGADMWGSFDDVPERYSARLLKAKEKFVESLTLHVGGAK